MKIKKRCRTRREQDSLKLLLRVLYISSANRNGISPVVKAQGQSLIEAGLEVHYYGIEGKGILGYLCNIGKIRKTLREVKPDIIHAHFSYSGFVARLATKDIPVVVSLMGSDVASGRYFHAIISFFQRLLWDKTIVKSEWMIKKTWGQRTVVIPNGVDLNQFYPMTDRPALKHKYGLSAGKKHIFFFADSARKEKNFDLAQKAIKQVSREDVELILMHEMPHHFMPELINAADVVLLTSRWEGSPNIVKEAMACNCPVVTTDVGDIAWLFGSETGYSISDPDARNLALNIELALELRLQSEVLNGRERIMKLGLDSTTIAQRIITEYNKLLNGQ